ncbi:MAG TPA: hypothetical protein VNY27_03180 [Solirubrobacteraceae bacterium]|jgi:hypothetical protein|nr:hypothetical protein [Solirubrobacteraceae bacterium]
MTTIRLSHDQLVSSINSDPERLADLLADTDRDYDRLLEKLDTQASWITEKMQRLQASIARSRETDPSTLSVNSLGELQGQAPELDRLCGEVEWIPFRGQFDLTLVEWSRVSGILRRSARRKQCPAGIQSRSVGRLWSSRVPARGSRSSPRRLG